MTCSPDIVTCVAVWSTSGHEKKLHLQGGIGKQTREESVVVIIYYITSGYYMCTVTVCAGFICSNEPTDAAFPLVRRAFGITQVLFWLSSPQVEGSLTALIM